MWENRPKDELSCNAYYKSLNKIIATFQLYLVNTLHLKRQIE